MVNPEVSIILPVYNGGQFLAKAIDSLLSQSLSNFELIVINDGSTDDSESIIHSFRDPRIRYIASAGNKGLVHALNTGIAAAAGKYIARMDADDISLQERLAIQKQWLDEHSDCSMISCRVEFINESDEPAGKWAADAAAVTARKIRKMLPYANCIAHSSIMGRSEVFKAYGYRSFQKNIEDYDLWLRLASDGKKIDKIGCVLLLYRIHTMSVTNQQLKVRNIFFKHFHCKRKYLYHRLRSGRFTFFDCQVLAYMSNDALMGILKSIKKTIHILKSCLCIVYL